MNVSVSDFFWLISVVAVLVVWWKMQGIKWAAFKRAKRHCEEMDVQMLDDSVVLRKLRLERDRDGWLKLSCLFEFEFTSTGTERYHGVVSLLGGRVRSVELEPHRL